jgi:hypothetical protein
VPYYHGYFRSLYTIEGQFDEYENTTYNVMNGTSITFADAWFPFKIQNSDFYNLPITLLIIIPVLLFLHIAINYMLQYKLHTHNKERKIKIMFEGIYSLLCPPLYFDWEMLFRESLESLTINQCWTRSKFMVLVNIMMHFVQHIVLCIPMMLMKATIAEREAQLSGHFTLLNDELHSTHRVNILLTAGLVTSAVLPFAQGALAYLYFTVGHPWSRILNAHL